MYVLLYDYIQLWSDYSQIYLIWLVFTQVIFILFLFVRVRNYLPTIRLLLNSALELEVTSYAIIECGVGGEVGAGRIRGEGVAGVRSKET